MFLCTGRFSSYHSFYIFLRRVESALNLISEGRKKKGITRRCVVSCHTLCIFGGGMELDQVFILFSSEHTQEKQGEHSNTRGTRMCDKREAERMQECPSPPVLPTTRIIPDLKQVNVRSEQAPRTHNIQVSRFTRGGVGVVGAIRRSMVGHKIRDLYTKSVRERLVIVTTTFRSGWTCLRMWI